MSSPSWLGFWEIVEFASIVIIAVGCGGEVWSEHYVFKDAFASPAPVKPSRERWNRIFGLMVVWGLVIELVAFTFSFIASNREIEGLKLDNIAREKQVEGLRQASDALEGEIAPRVIEVSAPVFDLKQFAGTEVAIVFSCSSPDCPDAALSIGSILQSSGWNIVGFVPSCKAMRSGIFAGICSTNANWDEMGDRGWRSILTDEALRIKHDSGISINELSKLNNACAAFVNELNKQGLDIAIDSMINFRTSLRFNGVVIFVGRKPTIVEAQIKQLLLKMAQEPPPDKNEAKANSGKLYELLHNRTKLASGTNWGGSFISGDAKLP